MHNVFVNKYDIIFLVFEYKWNLIMNMQEGIWLCLQSQKEKILILIKIGVDGHGFCSILCQDQILGDLFIMKS